MSEDYMLTLREVPHNDRMLKVLIDILMELKQFNLIANTPVIQYDPSSTKIGETYDSASILGKKPLDKK
jgi:hypothetical protein